MCSLNRRGNPTPRTGGPRYNRSPGTGKPWQPPATNSRCSKEASCRDGPARSFSSSRRSYSSSRRPDAPTTRRGRRVRRGRGRLVRAPAPTLGPVSDVTKAWWAYQRPATFGVVTEQVDVPMRDKIPIGCTLSRPATGGIAASGKFPGLVVEFTPYVAMADMFQGEASFFVARGYNALVCTLRGIGRSGGTWQPAMSSQDGRDAHDLVEWLATRPFADGRVGQFGESYGGQTSYGAAVEHPEHLLAVAPMQPPSDLYLDVIYPGGIKTTEAGTVDNWPGLAQWMSGGAIDPAAEYAANRAHPTHDAYWDDRSLLGRHDAITVPVLTIGGWNDGYFRSGTLANIEARPDKTWAIYGQFPHRPPIALCECPVSMLPSGVLLAWFDHWVMQLPNVPVTAAPTFVSYEGPEGTGAGWREISGWDPVGTGGISLQLGSDGSLAPQATKTGTVTFREPATSKPSDAGQTAASFTTRPLAADQVLLGHAALTPACRPRRRRCALLRRARRRSTRRHRDRRRRRIPRRQPPAVPHPPRTGQARPAGGLQHPDPGRPLPLRRRPQRARPPQRR